MASPRTSTPRPRRRRGPVTAVREGVSFAWLEAPAQGEVEVHALHEPLRLHAKERGARRGKGQALLLHGALVAGADPVALLREVERARVFRDRLPQDGLAVLQGGSRRQRAF